MRALTIFLLHCGNDSHHRPDLAVDNLDCLGANIQIVPSGFGTLNDLTTDTTWKMFLFSDERASNSLVEALPLYLAQERYNVLSMFRMDRAKEDERLQLENMKVSLTPRLFRSHITLRNNSFRWTEDYNEFINHTNILDGFLIGV